MAIINEQAKIAFFKALQNQPNPEELLIHLTEKLPALSLDYEQRDKESDVNNLDVAGKD